MTYAFSIIFALWAIWLFRILTQKRPETVESFLRKVNLSVSLNR